MVRAFPSRWPPWMLAWKAPGVPCVDRKSVILASSYCVAVQELKLSYHNGYISQRIGFPQYSTLN